MNIAFIMFTAKMNGETTLKTRKTQVNVKSHRHGERETRRSRERDADQSSSRQSKRTARAWGREQWFGLLCLSGLRSHMMTQFVISWRSFIANFPKKCANQPNRSGNHRQGLWNKSKRVEGGPKSITNSGLEVRPSGRWRCGNLRKASSQNTVTKRTNETHSQLDLPTVCIFQLAKMSPSC